MTLRIHQHSTSIYAISRSSAMIAAVIATVTATVTANGTSTTTATMARAWRELSYDTTSASPAAESSYRGDTRGAPSHVSGGDVDVDVVVHSADTASDIALTQRLRLLLLLTTMRIAVAVTVAAVPLLLPGVAVAVVHVDGVKGPAEASCRKNSRSSRSKAAVPVRRVMWIVPSYCSTTASNVMVLIVIAAAAAAAAVTTVMTGLVMAAAVSAVHANNAAPTVCGPR